MNRRQKVEDASSLRNSRQPFYKTLFIGGRHLDSHGTPGVAAPISEENVAAILAQTRVGNPDDGAMHYLQDQQLPMLLRRFGHWLRDYDELLFDPVRIEGTLPTAAWHRRDWGSEPTGGLTDAPEDPVAFLQRAEAAGILENIHGRVAKEGGEIAGLENFIPSTVPRGEEYSRLRLFMFACGASVSRSGDAAEKQIKLMLDDHKDNLVTVVVMNNQDIYLLHNVLAEDTTKSTRTRWIGRNPTSSLRSPFRKTLVVNSKKLMKLAGELADSYQEIPVLLQTDEPVTIENQIHYRFNEHYESVRGQA